ncbi:MAG TPA: hypothetical protein VF813_10185 [Anaerolineaceae bacterium]
MRTIKIGLMMVILTFATVSCDIFNGVSNLVSGKNTVQVSDLWPDVPRIDGLNKINVALPTAARVAMQGLESATKKVGGEWNFISFDTTHSAREVADFYTLDRMRQAGWNLTDTAGCTGQIGQVTPAGEEACFFGRQSSPSTNAFLLVFITRDDQTNKTQVFFARLEVKTEETPTP